ncbi:MAG: AarF/UbiB family protein [Gammaproteobacteria bacterium]|nr:AarF/UbiB family protein [Gammaproteobacteria bacterium]
MLEGFKRGVILGKAGLAAAQIRLSDDDRKKEIARKALANLFANARGIMMKVGQLLVDSEGSPYRQLLDNIEPYPLETMLPILQKSLGQPVENVFQSIEEANAAASLGQVHQAILKTGEQVAVKIQYPNIQDAVEGELKIAGLLPGMGPVRKWGFNLENYKLELRKNMAKELDYRSEAKRQKEFCEGVRVDGLVVPKIYEELCSEKVLVQSWEQGQNITEIENWPSEERQSVARILIKTLFKSLFVHGEIHGDPHIGNSFYRKRSQNNPEVILLDYGCTVPIPRTARLALLKLLIALKEETPISPMQCFVAMGFDGKKLSYIHHALPMMCQVLFRPFLADGRFRVVDWHVQKGLDSLLGEEKWWFRSSGPAELFLLIRAFQGLCQNLVTIKAFSDWYSLLIEAVGADLAHTARNFQLPPISDDLQILATSTRALAKTLEVEVWENTRQTVGVHLPANAILEIEDIMPQEVLEQLNASTDINLKQILDRVKKSGIAPQNVFEYSHGSKTYKVWLA